MAADKIKLLQSLHLLDQMPAEKLGELGDFLKDRALKDGETVFEEGSKGESLFFVGSGQVRISKRIAKDQLKDLAVLSAGDCFGEMAVLETVTRSARASAVGDTVVLELGRADLSRFLQKNPDLAMGFFTELVQVQSRRLRRTSSELALLFDLSGQLLDRHATPKALLSRVLENVVPHLQGNWSAAAYLYNMFNDEMDLIATHGSFRFEGAAAKVDPKTRESKWLDGALYYAPLPGESRPQGHLLFHVADAQNDEDRTENARTIAAVARLVAAGVENIGFRNEETLRNRLRASGSY